MRLVQVPMGSQLADHPRVLTDAMARGGAVAQRAFEAMMTMRKIDVAAIEAAVKEAL